MNFSENTNLLPGGQSASPSKIKELDNKIDDLAQTVTSVADSVADLADEVTTEELNATSANITNAVIDNATVGTETATEVNADTVNADNLNATDADITNLTADDVEANSVDADNGYFGSVNAQSFTGQGVNITGDITASAKVQGKTVQATEKIVTPALESTQTELKGATTVRGDVYFPETGDKIYGEYLEVDANKVKVKSLTTETPTGSSQLVGYDANGKLIPVDAGLDPSNYWELVPGDQTAIQPKDEKGVKLTDLEVESVKAVDVTVGDPEQGIGGLLVTADTTLNGTLKAGDTTIIGDLTVSDTGYFDTTLRDTEVDGDLTVNGDIIQNGSAYETHAEKVYSKNDLIITRDGAVSGLSTGEFTGIQAEKYDGTNDGQLVFDKDGEARVGDVGDTEPLMTRDELADMTDGSLLKWDGVNKKAVCGKSADIIPSDASTSNKLITTDALDEALAKYPNAKYYSTIQTQDLNCNNIEDRVALVTPSTGYASLNYPAGELLFIMTSKNSGGDGFQKAISWASQREWNRTLQNGVWGSWCELAIKSDLTSYAKKVIISTSQTTLAELLSSATAQMDANQPYVCKLEGQGTGVYTGTILTLEKSASPSYAMALIIRADSTTLRCTCASGTWTITEITQNQTLPGYTKLTASGSTSINLSNITFNELVVEVEGYLNSNYTFNILKDMLTTSNKSFYSGCYASTTSNSSCRIEVSTTSIKLAALIIYTGNGHTNVTADSTLNVYYR